MEIKGRKIQKRYLFVAALVALIIPRCVQMNMAETALKEKLAAGGFDNEYEMENIVGSGFTTKAEFEKFVRTTPIPSSEGESTVQCAAVASFWEERELSLKTNVGDLTPKTIRSVMNSDLIYDYAVGKTTNSILTARRDHLVKQLEAQFEKEGVSDSLKSKYLDCHAKFGPYVEKKCGATGVCEESTELVGLDGKPISGQRAPEGGVAQSSISEEASTASIEKIFETKWQMADDIPCSKDGGTYFVYDREYGSYPVAGGAEIKPERKPNISVKTVSDTVAEMSVELYGTPLVQESLGEDDVVASYQDFRLELQEDGRLRALSLVRAINFDAMLQGRKQYDEPKPNMMILTACP